MTEWFALLEDASPNPDDGKINKKLSCCRDSARYDEISDSGRSANHNCNPKYDLRYIDLMLLIEFNKWNSLPSHVVSASMLNCFRG